MHPITKSTCAAIVLAAAVTLAASSSANAITVELAKKCREMSFKAYPPRLTGSKKGDAANERKYYEECIQNNGTMPQTNQHNESAPPPK